MSITYQEAVAYSHNFATAKPDIGTTEKEHILGLCKVLEQVGAERDAYNDMAHGMSSDLDSVGAERDALAAHVERMRQIAEQAFRELDDDPCPTAHEIFQVAVSSPETSLARLIAEKQAEALDDLRNELMSDLPDPCRRVQVADAFILRIATLRWQAGGDA